MSAAPKHITEADYVTTVWSGGKTSQLAIAPAGAVYADRDFLWRLSSATCELEESDFTPLPDYTRLIATLEGGIVLTHNGGEPLKLRPFEVHRFDGGDDTHSVGCCVDYNLMLRKGKVDGSVTHCRIEPGAATAFTIHPGCTAVMVCCYGGEVSHSASGEVLRHREALLFEEEIPGSMVFASATGCDLMIAEVYPA